MPVLKLTKSAIDKVEHPVRGQALYLDSDLKGFGLCVGKTAKTYFAQREVKGKTVRVTIGRHGVFTAESARKEARDLLARMSRGDNPNIVKKVDKENNIALAEAFNAYLDDRKRLSPKTIYDYRRAINLYLKDWQKRPLQDITKNMVSDRFKKLGDKHGHSTANGTMRVLRAIFNHARVVNEGLITENPVWRLSQARAWHKLERRRSYIKQSDLQIWFREVMALENETARDYMLILLFTGMRRSEAARVKWSDIDFKRRSLVIPETKNREPHALPLSDFLLDLLSRRKETVGDSEFVFPGKGKSGHIEEPKRFVQRVIALSGVKFMLHDLRRTFITTAESLDIPHYALKKLLNHKITGDVTADYIVIDIERLREPMQRITDYILREVGMKKKADVIEFHRAKQGESN